MSDPRSMTERYLSATATSNLRVGEGTCDADKLLAAAYATGGDKRKSLALKVWRARATGSLSGVHELVSGLGGLLRDAERYKSRRGNNHANVMSWHQAQALAIQVLRWWKHPTCAHCDGLGHPTLPNAPVLDTTRECGHCGGTGQVPLERQVRQDHIEHARWLVSEMEGLSSSVFDDMARLLRRKLDF